MKAIALTGGLATVVDDEDYDALAQHQWFAHRNGNTYYAQRNSRGTRHRHPIHMHRCITHCPEWCEVDHINHNGLDNRKHNLRVCTKSQNQQNRTKTYEGTSCFKGVRRRPGRPWEARIRFHGALRHLGKFSDERVAALAYDYAASVYFGEYAYFNRPFGSFLGEQI